MPLTFLVPDIARLTGDAPRLVALETLLTRADRYPAPEAGLRGMLADLFQVSLATIAMAPLTRLADGGRWDDAFWFRADPVH
ncbi:MAG: hypothetical protein ACRESU_11155, partial [Gammaproteobacteria bacterium]